MIQKYFIFDYKAWHHLYTGFILMIIGIFILPSMWGIVLISIGTWLFLDDLGQHRLQYVYNNPKYHSYGHYIGKPFYQMRRWLIKKYNWTWLNKI
jgi:hypothetical protein